MEVMQSGLLDFIGSDGRFIIPAYQRLYSWTTSQCEELWLDIMRAGRADRNHFLGTLLYRVDDREGEVRVFEIIDGQQRLTTVSLIILALSHYLNEHPEESGECGVDPDVIMTDLIVGRGRGDDNDPLKLTLSQHDIPAYRAVVGGREADPSSTIVKNLSFFKEKTEMGGFDLGALLEGLRCLTVVLVHVDDPEEAQAIFESINSKGMQLNVADMVRNYLLLAECHDEQTRLYERYWKPSQEMFAPDPGSLKLNTGIKSWLSIRLKGARILSAGQVYSSFKAYAEDVYQGEKEPILRELRGFCLMWAENFRYHGVKRFRSGIDWAEIGAPTLTAGYELKKANNEAYAQKLREQLREADSCW